MGKKVIFLIIGILLVIPFLSAFSGSGDGSSGNPFQITNCTQVQEINSSLSSNYILINNIDCTNTSSWNGGKGFSPIGFGGIISFNGSLDGQGYTIFYLKINRTTQNSVGLFMSSNGIIKNLTLDTVNITGNVLVGGIAGIDNGIIRNVVVSGYFYSNNTAGGLVGQKSGGIIKDSHSAITIVGKNYIGGLVGYLITPAIIDTSYASSINYVTYLQGDVKGLSGNATGGLVGLNAGIINNSYAVNSVYGGSNSTFVGGLVGNNYLGGIINNSFSTGIVTGNKSVGGLVGNNNGAVSNSFWDMNTSGINTSDGGTGLIVDQMTTFSTFNNSNWNISKSNIDLSNLNTNAYYPYLGFQGNNQTSIWLIEPYVFNITDCEELQRINVDRYGDKNYLLMNDINCSETKTWNNGSGFLPLGIFDIEFIEGLTGNFDGQNHKITDLYINSSDYVGLFMAFYGNVSNLILQNVNIIGDDAVGGLVGLNEGNITNCSVSGTITAVSQIGGIVGYNRGTINFSSSSANVNGNTVGSLVGDNEGNVSNSYSTGIVSGGFEVGGLVGYNFITGIVNNSYAQGNVNGADNTGGLIGDNNGVVSMCYSIGIVNGTTNTGGLIGANSGNVNNSFWNTQTSGQSFSAGGTGKTTSQMKNVRTYTNTIFSSGLNSSWDFVGNPFNDSANQNIWNIDSHWTINNGYPFFAKGTNQMYDDIAPIITIITPTQFQSFNFQNNIPFDVIEFDNLQLKNCWYSRDNGVTNQTFTCLTNFTVSEAGNGIYNMTIWADDNSGNLGVARISYVVSLTAPAVTINFPTSNSGVNVHTIDFNVTVLDAAGIANCSLWINSTGIWNLDQTSTAVMSGVRYKFSKNLSDGNYKFNFQCFDNSSLSSFGSSNFTFIVDTTIPSASINSIITTAGSQTIYFLSSESGSNLISCTYSVFNSIGVVDGINDNISYICNLNPHYTTTSSYGNFTLTTFVTNKGTNVKSTSLNFITSAISGGNFTPSNPTGGGGGGSELNQTLTAFGFCGDGICQDGTNGTKNRGEDFYNCAIDCGVKLNLQNINFATIFANCVSKDVELNNQCLWKTRPGLLTLAAIIVLIFVFGLLFSIKPKRETIKTIKYNNKLFGKKRR